MRRVMIAVAGTVAGATLVITGVLPVFANHIAPHQHFVQTPTGALVPVGPDACANGPSTAFDNFHLNIHVGTVGTVAMDHPHNRTDIVAIRACP